MNSCKGFGPCGRVSPNTRDAVSGERRLTVSLATPASRQSWPNDQSFISKAPSLPASSISPSPATDRTFKVRGGCQISRVCCFCHWTCCESTPSDEKHSSGVRRKSSLDARVRFMDCSLGNGL